MSESDADPASVVLASYAAIADIQACLVAAPDDDDAAKLRADLEAAAVDALALLPTEDDVSTSYTPTWATADPLDPPPSFADLAERHPPLAAALAAGRPPGRLDFADPAAVAALTRATLIECFKLAEWTLPPGALVPPVPARAAYLRRMALIVGGGHPPPFPLRIVDVGCGANLIFPLLAASPVFGWTAVGLDVTPAALAGAAENLRLNPGLVGKIVLRAGPPPSPAGAAAAAAAAPPPSILPHAFRAGDPPAHFLVCNPPFFESAAAQAATAKAPGAGGHAGTPAETVWADGGEAGFVGRMAAESADLADRVAWFSAMLGRKASVAAVKRVLAGTRPSPPEVRVFALAAGGERTTRWVVAWSFQQREQGWGRATAGVVRGRVGDGGGGGDGERPGQRARR